MMREGCVVLVGREREVKEERIGDGEKRKNV
jgi:hypothetical protein